MDVAKKILVYDSQHGFSRFLTKQFGNDHELKIFKKFTQEDDFSELTHDFAMIFFMLYSTEDLFDFLRIYRKKVPVTVCSYNPEILKRISKISDIMVMDVSKAKTELVHGFNLILYPSADKTIRL
ncbi:hypothetical protein [Flavobacterium sp. 22076]|uniref:hypothetical protein n=1 Tax=unclassified Flavobacterium TaxID=196869 RepID=UPI003F82F48F